MSLLPPPFAIGAPPKFSAWRLHQPAAILKAIETEKRYIAKVLPTGSGKSLTVVGAALLAGWRTAILTSTKLLQTQYCVTRDTRILTADLRYVTADTVKTGDSLMGFDEHRSPNRRMWRRATVLGVERITRPCYRLHLDDGSAVECSHDHQWLTPLTGSHQAGTRREWMRSDALRVGGKHASSLLRLLPVWEAAASYAEGYLAAAFDGEGCLIQGDPARGNGAHVALQFAQRPNAMFEQVCRYLRDEGFDYTAPFGDPCFNVQLCSRAKVLEFLGRVRPPRLLEKFNPDRMGMIGPVNPVRIIARYDIGEQEVIAIKTDTRTYVAEGFASHNCDDFGEIGMQDVRGMNSYPCVAFKDEHMQYAEPTRWQSCEEGPCHAGNYCSRKPSRQSPDASGCQYYDAVARARDARLVVTNYKFWMSQHYFGQGLGNFDCLVLDEAHNAPQELADFLSTELSNKDIEGTLQAAFPTEIHDVAAWGAWAKRVSAQVERQLELWKPHSKAEMTRFRALKSVARKLVILGTMNATDWVMTEDNGVWHFDPIWVKDHKETLFVQTPKVILTSATFNQKTAQMMGLALDEMEWHEAASDFPIERRPVYYIPTVKVDFRTDASMERMLIARHDQIVRARQDRKGITHTVSYKRRNMLMEGSEFKARMIVHDSRTAKTAVEQFKAAKPGALLVSPSMTTGYDFPMAACEYQIILKIPFPDSRSPVVKARTAADKDYPAYIAMQELVQAVGRGMRSLDDQCEVFILDDNASWFMAKYKHFAPKWFLQAYRRVETLPVPPPRLVCPVSGIVVNAA